MSKFEKMRDLIIQTDNMKSRKQSLDARADYMLHNGVIISEWCVNSEAWVIIADPDAFRAEPSFTIRKGTITKIQIDRTNQLHYELAISGVDYGIIKNEVELFRTYEEAQMWLNLANAVISGI